MLDTPLPKHSKRLSMKRLSERTGLSRVTLWKYCKQGIISPDPDTDSDYMVYTEDMVERAIAHHRRAPVIPLGDQPAGEQVSRY